MKLKILLPTDLSDNSWNAMVYALHMFKDTPCVFYILHSYKITASSMSNISNKLMTTLKEKAADELYDYKCQLQDAKINPEFEFEIILSSRDLLDAVNVAAVAVMLSVLITMSIDTLTDWRAIGIAGISAFFIFSKWKISVMWLIAGGAVLGYLLLLL